jgi:diaminopimelate epimerase
MQVNFRKYHGTGNDFILIDNRNGGAHLLPEQIYHLCHRRFGIGADGLMLLESEPGVDFRMVYYNSDGNQSSMCGNGGRAITIFAKDLGIVQHKARFTAIDGLHEALIDKENNVSLKMQDVKQIEIGTDSCFLNTGSPHFVKIVKDVEHYDIVGEGKKIRFSERFREEGTNVNFIEKVDDHLFVRTYERGVEDETYSCGTGVTAAALVASIKGISTERNNCSIKTLGGTLDVSFEKVLEQNFYNIWLKGPAIFVFEGLVNI